MSYDIYLLDPATKKVVEFDQSHDLKGGTYALGGTTEAWLNITYNYSNHFYRVLGDKGIRTIYGMTAADSIPLLEKAIVQLKDDVNPDYWKSTEGNAKIALMSLLGLARMKLDGIWDGY